MSTLVCNNLTMQFGGLMAVHDVSLEIKSGSITGLIGPNGAGKTTLFNMITGNLKPTSGKVLFLNNNIIGMKPYKIVALGMARTFQNIRLFSSMSVLENTLIGFHHGIRYKLYDVVFRTPFFSGEEKRMRQTCIELLRKLKLDDKLQFNASNLPYGDQRRVEIARALATSPKLLLLDEPAAGMNPQETTDLMHFIFEIRDRFDLTILLIEHDMRFVMGICETVAVLDHGEKIAQGTPAEIHKNKKVIAAYLGEQNA